MEIWKCLQIYNNHNPISKRNGVIIILTTNEIKKPYNVWNDWRGKRKEIKKKKTKTQHSISNDQQQREREQKTA